MKNSFRYRYFLFLSVAVFVICACTPAGPPYQKFEKDTEVPRITLDEAKAAFDSGSALFVDARGDVAFNQEHIKGAISIPNGGGEDRFSQLPKGKKIIVYCSWPNEHSSASLAFQMNQKEISNVYALLGGTNAWKGAGYPMESSPADANTATNPAGNPAPQSANTPPERPKEY